MSTTHSAGDKLRTDMASALEAAAAAAGRPLEWSEAELDLIERAAHAADKADQMRELYAAEEAGEHRLTTMVKLSAEMRLCDKQAADLVARLQPNPAVPHRKSPQHVRAGKARWARQAPVA